MNPVLEGIRVVDLTRILAGPFATMRLADLGADIIKIERPGVGDDTRAWGPPFIGDWSTYFLSVNRGKRSLTLNLKDPRGIEILETLIRGADVIISNFRPGTMEKLGIDYARCRQINSRIIYAIVSGYGDSPDQRGNPSYDVIVQGESGVMDLTGLPEHSPTKVGISLADEVAGMLAVEGILAALFSRERTGKGQKVDVALMDGMLSLLSYQGQSFFATGESPRRRGNAHPSIVPYETFPTEDGYLNIGVGNEKLWSHFCQVLGRADWVDNADFRTNTDRVLNRARLVELIQGVLKERPTEYWLGEFKSAGIPCGKIQTVAEALSDPDREKRGIVTEVPGPEGTPLPMVGCPVFFEQGASNSLLPAPELGAHTDEILGEIGLNPTERNELLRLGVV
ncbi:MAG: CoA transferase [Planctomycetota bacterium]|nr:CoA transferase [Planctomycetota bacterium]